MRARRASSFSSAGRPQAPPPAPKALAVRWLARRDYSRAELEQRLAGRGVPADAIRSALDELVAAGYLSDARFARAVVNQRAASHGRRAIAHHLREKGVAASEVTAALAPLAQEDEYAAALALWQRRFGATPKDHRDKARQIRFLQARGYPLSTALRILRAAGSAAVDEPEEADLD